MAATTTPMSGDIRAIKLRPASQVMKLARMGASFPTRLSFMRSLIRRIDRDNCTVEREIWEIDSDGYGRAVYTVTLGGNRYSLIAFSTYLAPDKRSDRVIATAWDASFVLFDGVPTRADIDRIEANAPLQEAGRFEPSELVLSRANRSVRMFEHVIDRLSQGLQPDAAQVAKVGYLMRTTAVYGNGKFGIAERERIAEREELSAPFQAEMLAVWLIRGFTHDLVEHIAHARGGENSAGLTISNKRGLGIGNSTGLGMAPFIVHHPRLLNNWVLTKETALGRVLAIEHSEREYGEKFLKLMVRATSHINSWQVDDERQMDRIKTLREEMGEFNRHIGSFSFEKPFPWQALIDYSANHSFEFQELLVAMVIEPHGKLVDELACGMSDNATPHFDPAMQVGDLLGAIKSTHQWALNVDFSETANQKHFWYVSEEKQEPRLGLRFEEPGAELETPLDVARMVCKLHEDLGSCDGRQSVAYFLTLHPQHRHIIKRIQNVGQFPYCEIQDNLIGAQLVPLDMLRFKLSFFGACKFDPKSNLWTRINMYQGAPVASDIGEVDCDDWWLPVAGDAPCD